MSPRTASARFGIGVSSGTDALLLALMALDIGPGHEVITSPYTFFATAGTIARTGARPTFCDIDPVSFNLDPKAVEFFIEQQLRSSRRGAGEPRHRRHREGADAGASVWPGRRHGSRCSPWRAAMGSRSSKMPPRPSAPPMPEGRRACSLGDIGCLSFFPTKNLGAFGDAGMCVTQDEALAERMSILRVHGGKPKYYHALIGGNFRIDELQAAVLNVKLPHLDAWTAARQRNAAFYDSAFAKAKLGAAVRTPHAAPGGRHIYNQYVIRARDRDALRKHLAERSVGSEIYYPVPLHLQQCFAYLGQGAGSFPACGSRGAGNRGTAHLPGTGARTIAVRGRQHRGVLRMTELALRSR